MNDTTHLVDGKYGIRDLVDLVELRRMFARFTEATGFTIGFLDHPGLNILIATGWQDICTKFHRGCPISADICARSNRRLLDHLDEPGQLRIEPCAHGLVDCGFPIIVKGKHIASLATGQLLLGKPDLEQFKRQARLFGFDEREYLRALAEVPVVAEEKLRSVTTFLGEMALVLSDLGYAHLIARETTARLQNEIIERHQAEAALRESEMKFRTVFDSAADGMFAFDIESRKIVMSNTACSRMLGYTPEEFLNKSIPDLHLPEDLPFVLDLVGEFLKGQERERKEVRFKRRDGSTFFADASPALITLDGRKTVLAAISDVTARKHTESTLAQKNAALRELLEQMGAEKGRIHENIVANMEDAVMPLLAKLRLKGASRKYVKLLEHHLRDLTSPYARHIATGKTRRLTPRETEICAMIKAGLPSKDIAEMLGISRQTVERHRRNIRRRLDLTGKKQNLTSFLANC